ncbi:MAG: CGNR zinc finger domain-containing protein [Pseudomonadota bacterium]
MRECAGDDCRWLFLDLSKNGARRWCSTPCAAPPVTRPRATGGARHRRR